MIKFGLPSFPLLVENVQTQGEQISSKCLDFGQPTPLLKENVWTYTLEKSIEYVKSDTIIYNVLLPVLYYIYFSWFQRLSKKCMYKLNYFLPVH